MEISKVLAAGSKDDSNHPSERYIGRISDRSLAEILDNYEIIIYPEDKYEIFPDPSMGLGSILNIARATTVNLNDGDSEKVIRTWKGTVGDLLSEKKIKLGDQDIVEPGKEAKIAMNMDISITRVTVNDNKEIVTVPFKTVSKDDPNLLQGKQRIEVEGANGSKEKIYRIRKENGKLVSKILVSEKVLKEPVDKVVFKGTKSPINYVSKGKYMDLINAAGAKYGVSPAALYCLMIRESNGNARSAAAAGYKGLFQYGDGAWSNLSSKAGYKGASVFDPEAQIYTTAWAISNGQSSRWGPWSACKNK